VLYPSLARTKSYYLLKTESKVPAHVLTVTISGLYIVTRGPVWVWIVHRALGRIDSSTVPTHAYVTALTFIAALTVFNLLVICVLPVSAPRRPASALPPRRPH